MLIECQIQRTKTTLPATGHSEVNLCSVLSLGKDLSKITMPVMFNEPLSFLQRVAEYMEYAKLLKQAALETSPLARLQRVSAFAVSAMASNYDRLGKPFNPLLGETYELQRDDFRIICEQVSHHPPVSAFHADSDDFIFHGSIQPKLKFWGKSIEVHPKGVVTVELPKWNEAYTWQNVNCILHNVLVGQIWMEQLGVLEIKQHGGANLKAELSFKSAGCHSKDLHRVEGFLVDQDRKRLAYLYGKWTESLRACEAALYEDAVERIKRERSPQNSPGHKKVLARLSSLKVGAFKPLHQDAIDESDLPSDVDGVTVDEIPGSTLLWEVTPRPPNSADYYQFTTFAMSLNELEPELKEHICPTDSRLRPDIRKLESGDQDGAASEKSRLEEKQRVSRKSSKHKKNPPNESVPRWFLKGTNNHTGLEDWLYQGGYWDRNYADVEDIF
ncbi:oxysterol-binding protein-related protein 2 isoform X2 [Copidosoma floridanum]|uniref:oxysterol-binding protein-related protein 2 isoform X2 n=1 Tax=Copidosoma floridanum TaxID=29053 RepID=UPI0006C9863E|nr:oxysterol-binding protein-related protein 2 isoform X2 [Copidosoma floridanum]